MKPILAFLGSMKTMAVLMLIFAFSIGYATIIENDFGTMTAKAEIYNARWFEVLLGFLAFNLFLNMINFKMMSWKKAPIFIFHSAFFIILIGAAITRYVGYEGTMHIREGHSANAVLSSNIYFEAVAQKGKQKVEDSQVVFLSKRHKNSLGTHLSVDGKK